MNFIKRFFVNLDARRRAGNLRSFMRKLGKRPGYALDAKEIHSFFADGRYDVYFALKEKVVDLDRQSELMKDALWEACIKHHVEVREGLRLEIICTGAILTFKNVDFFNKIFDLEITWTSILPMTTRGNGYDSFTFNRADSIERLKKIGKLKKKNELGHRSEVVKRSEYWFIIDLNFAANMINDINRLIKNWELMEVK